jgi:hypothetical protein
MINGSGSKARLGAASDGASDMINLLCRRM